YNYANADPINLHDPSGNAAHWNWEFWTADFWDPENIFMWIVVIVVVIVVVILVALLIILFPSGLGFWIGLGILLSATVGIILVGVILTGITYEIFRTVNVIPGGGIAFESNNPSRNNSSNNNQNSGIRSEQRYTSTLNPVEFSLQ
ncbi:MAG: hypothetical protein GY814_06265, partial [Gammaproteobacteria bacterium]|nr:hypothetical protein [Gammaproteobacteria bacterium]